MTLKIANNTADIASYLARNCVKSIELGQHSAVSQICPFSRQNFLIILKTNYQQQFFVKQHSITVMVWPYLHVKCRFF